MYPKIFNKTEVEFTTNGLGFLSDATKVLVTEERNGGFYLEMEYPLNGQNAKYLKYDYIILAKPNPVDKPQPFRIYDTKKSKNNRNILVKANHITFDDANNFLLNFSRSKTPANVLLDQMTKSKTQKNKITYSTNIDTAISVDWSKRSPVNAIAGEQGSFIQALNSEIKRDMWKVTVNATRGRKSSYVARDEKGLTEFDYEEDISSVVTKLYPFKTYKPDNSDKDKTIELKEKYIVSDNADKYPFERIAYLDLSQDDKIKNEDDLRKAALKKFTQEHIDLPKISGTLKVLNLSNNPEYSFIGNLSSVLLCDYIWCVSKTIQEKVQVQVNKVVYNPILEDYDSIDVGMKKQSLAQSINNSINNVQNQVTNIQNQVTNIVDRGDGTKSITSVEEPTEEQYDLNDGDLWFQELPNGDMNIWVWDDTQKIWKPVFSKEDFNKYMEEAQKAKEDALNAINKADQAVNTADELTNKVVKIDTDIENINQTLRNPNIISNPEPMFTLVDYPKTQDSVPDGDWQKLDNRVNNKEILTKNNLMFQASSGKKITQQVEIEVEGELQSLTFSFYTNQQNRVPATIKNLGNKRYIAYATWTSNSNGNIRLMDIINVQFTGSFIKFRHPKLEYGDYTSYYINSEEINNSIVEVKQTQKGLQETVSNIDGRLTQNTQTIDGFNRKIQGIEGQITEINETSEGLRVDVDNNKGSIGTLTASSEIFQSKLQNLEEDTTTKITQLDKLIQLQASQIGPFYPNGNFDDENLTNWYELTWNDIGASVQIQDKTLVLQSTSTAKASAITKDYIEVDGTQPFIIKFQAQWARVGNKANARIYVHEYDENKTEIRNANDLIFNAEHYPDKFWNVEKRWITDKNPKYIRIEWVAWGNPGTTLKLKNITLSNGVGNLSSSVNVALDSASLAVKKDDVINSVNVSTEGVQINGSKVHITGQTTIDNAVIKDAMIANLSANKLTAGTIDASKIKVTNLDVNTLTGNKSKFLETIWADNNSYSKITPDGMRFYKSADGILQKDSYLNIYSNELKWKTSEPQWHYISEATKRGLSLLTIGAVTGKGIEPASIAINSSGYNNLAVANQSGYFSGKYLFLGNVLTTIPQTEGQRKASTDLCNINGFFGIDDTKCYRIAMTAANDISLMVSDTKGGGKIRFYNGGGIDSYSSCFEYRTDNGIGMMLKSIPIYSRTYSSSANLFITENGYIGRSTSARKYKENIEYIDNLEEAKRVLDIQPAEWADKEQMMSHARARAGISKPEGEERLTRRYIGFIADDFADAGFEKLITRDKTGEVEEFQYNRLSVYHHQLIKDLYNQVEELKTEIKELKEK